MKSLFFTLLFLVLSLTAHGTQDSIYKVDPVLDSIVTGSALAVSAAIYGFSDQIFKPRCPCSSSEINGFDRGAVDNRNDGALVATDIVVGAALVAPLIVDWHLREGFTTSFLEDSLVFIEVVSVVGAITSLTKAIVQRPLPRTYAGDPTLVNSPGGYRSFFSGHTATTAAALTAAAVTFGKRTELGLWPWVTAGVLTLGVGIGRVSGGVHFNTDVIVGAVVGGALGVLIPWLHESSSRKESQSRWKFYPQPQGILLSHRW